MQFTLLKQQCLNSLISLGQNSGVSQAAIQVPASVEENASLFNLPKTVGFPPKLLEAYGWQMRKVKGHEESQPIVEETESSMQAEEQYSGTNHCPFGSGNRLRMKFVE